MTEPTRVYGYFQHKPAVFEGGAWVTIDTIIAQRDAARAEVAFLKGLLATVDDDFVKTAMAAFLPKT